MLERGWFWLDVDFTTFTSGIANEVQLYGTIHSGSVSAAPRTISRDPGRWAGVITHLTGRARELEYLRELVPSLPVLVLVEEPLTERSAAQVRGGALQYVSIERCADAARSFALRTLTASLVPSPAVVSVVQEMTERLRLTPREVRILVYTLANEERSDVQERMGLSHNTFRQAVKGLVHKGDARNLESLAVSVLRAAVLKSSVRFANEASTPHLEVVR